MLLTLFPTIPLGRAALLMNVLSDPESNRTLKGCLFLFLFIFFAMINPIGLSLVALF